MRIRAEKRKRGSFVAPSCLQRLPSSQRGELARTPDSGPRIPDRGIAGLPALGRRGGGVPATAGARAAAGLVAIHPGVGRGKQLVEAPAVEREPGWTGADR